MKYQFILPAILGHLLFVNILKAQVIQGTVTDATTRKPLAFVHIGVLHKNAGTISHEDGTFGIDLSSVSKNDSLTFSMIGYERESFLISGLNETSLSVSLKPKSYLLREVVLRDKPLPKFKFGRTELAKITTGSSGEGNYGWGGETGIQIFRAAKPYRIIAVSFHHRWNTLDSILYRINIYNVKDGMPDESILHREIFLTCRDGDKWATKNLETDGLIFDQDLVVSFEVVRKWFSSSGENLLFYSHGKGYEKSNTFIRSSSLDNWRVQKDPALTFYLTVEELE